MSEVLQQAANGRAGYSPGRIGNVHQQWVLPALFWLTTATLVSVRQGMILTLVFPVFAILTGLWLFFRNPVQYVGFVLWLWFLSPEVRRLADWSIGAFSPINPIQASPLAVTMISIISLLRFYPMLAQRRGLSFGLILAGLVYALVIGIAANGFTAAIYDFASWVFPILVGFHIMIRPEQFPAIRETITKTFMWGMLVMGAYGLVQYFFMPPWDVMWMVGSKMRSQGDPVPLGVRVFSTMNSSGPFAMTMLASMVYVTGINHRVRWIAGAVGLFSFALSLVRAAWGGWVIALILQLISSSNRARLRIIAGAALLSVLFIPVLALGPVADRIQARLQTIANLNDDESYTARSDFYAAFAKTAFSNMTGEGLGATGLSTKLSSDDANSGKYATFDSGLMNIPFVLGWPGTLLYLSGFLWLFTRAFLASVRMRDDRFIAASISLAFAVFAMLVFVNTLTGISGLVLFVSVCSILSASHYEKLRRRSFLAGVGDEL